MNDPDRIAPPICVLLATGAMEGPYKRLRPVQSHWLRRLLRWAWRH